MSLANTSTVFVKLLSHRYLLGQLVKRDVLLRYRGAMFGVLWIFLSPLLMLARACTEFCVNGPLA